MAVLGHQFALLASSKPTLPSKPCSSLCFFAKQRMVQLACLYLSGYYAASNDCCAQVSYHCYYLTL